MPRTTDSARVYVYLITYVIITELYNKYDEICNFFFSFELHYLGLP